ncbi:hypothetical protein llap_21320 [Limosa lapponica baueri]|uniref:F-actin-capping protein subunit beta n=1 Tax=Limosa lapponica baueri TaxID=1758121 RepID=A0A2I0T3K0_LIMLA|nr:hypothetical protein llap_21320 [Limosa lapponica baueri]
MERVGKTLWITVSVFCIISCASSYSPELFTVILQYFEGGVSSVYLWDLDHGFAGVILIKKAGDGSKKIKGCWDSIHVVEVQEKSSGRTAHYKLTSTVMLWLQTNKTGSGTMNLGGSLTRQMALGAGNQAILVVLL